MAGAASMLNPTHASREAGMGRFRQQNVVEASVTMLGRKFVTTIHEGATTNELIEKVARENGGEVSKRYYPEFKTWEITSVRIGDSILVKSSESGIHFSLGESGIPMAVTEKQGIVFPNADELRIGKNTNNIALWTTSANFDPGSVGDIDRMYKGSGGVRLSQDARDEISKAHGGVRSGNGILLEENILVLNKDTGEILTVSQHASKLAENPLPPDFTVLAQPAVPFAPTVQSFPSSMVRPPAAPSTVRMDSAPLAHEHARYDPALFDAFRGGAGIQNGLIIRTFDGSISDSISVSFNPFSQDTLGTVLRPMPQSGAAMQKSPSLEDATCPKAGVAPKRLSFCLLSFEAPASVRNPGAEPAPNGRPGPSPSAGLLGKPQKPPTPQAPGSSPSIEAAYAAWKAARFKPAVFGIPAGTAALRDKMPDAGLGITLAEAKELLARKAGQTIKSTLMLAATLLSIARSMKGAAKARAKAEGVAKKPVPSPIAPEAARKKPKTQKSGMPEQNPAGTNRRTIRPKEAKARLPHGNPASNAPKNPARSNAMENMPDVRPHRRKKRRNPHTQPAKPAASMAEKPKASRPPRVRAGIDPALRAGKKKKPPRHFLYEMLGLYWKKRGRKLRMKKKSAP